MYACSATATALVIVRRTAVPLCCGPGAPATACRSLGVETVTQTPCGAELRRRSHA